MNVTVPPVLATGVTIASVLTSAFVDLSEQVATPEALVAEQAPSVLSDPVAEKVGVTPGTGAPLASRSVIVTVDAAIPLAATGDVPVMLELAAAAP